MEDLPSPKGELSDSLIDEICTFLDEKTEGFKVGKLSQALLPENLEVIHSYSKLRGISLSGFSLGTENQQFKSVIELLERYLFIEFKDFLKDFENSEFPSRKIKVNLENDIQISKKEITGIQLNNLEKVNIDKYFLGIENHLERFTSIGCAIHTNSMNAVYNSILEQIENHVIDLHLLQGRKPSRVSVESHDYAQFMNENLAKHGFGLDVFCFHENTFPVYLTLITNHKNEFPFLFHGLGMAMTPEEGLIKSIKEAVMCWSLELPMAKESFEKRGTLNGDVSESAKFYDPLASTHFWNEWQNSSFITQKQILTADNNTLLLQLIEDLNFVLFPVVSECGNLTFVKSFSEKIIPKSYSKPPFLPEYATMRQVENLKTYPY